MFHFIQESSDNSLENNNFFNFVNYRIDRRVFDKDINLDYQIELFNKGNQNDLFLLCDFYSNEKFKDWIIELWNDGELQVSSNNKSFLTNISSFNKNKERTTDKFKVIIKSKKDNKIVESIDFYSFVNSKNQTYKLYKESNLIKVKYANVFKIKNNEVHHSKKYWNLNFNFENIVKVTPIYNTLSLFFSFDVDEESQKHYRISSLDFNVNKANLNINGLGLEKDKINLRSVRDLLENTDNKFDLIKFYIDDFITFLPDERKYTKSQVENGDKKIIIPIDYFGKLIFSFDLETTFGNFKIIKEFNFKDTNQEFKTKTFEVNDVTEKRNFLENLKYTIDFKDYYDLKNKENITYFIKKKEEYEIQD